jgi:hypothetical protein
MCLYRKLPFLVVITCSIILAPACSKFTAMGKLSRAISQKFKIADVRVELRDPSILVIGLTNSSIGDLGDPERRVEAQRVAFFAKNNYQDIAHVERFWVVFIRQTDVSLLEHHKVLSQPYGFEKAKLTDPPPAKPLSAAAGHARVQHNPSRDETEISADGILLYGEQAPDGTTRNGMNLLPHFTLKGKMALEPKEVVLDFAAFSPVAIFDTNRDLVITADGVEVAKGKAKLLSSGEIADGQRAEYLTYTVDYPTFQQLANSNTVTIRIGFKSAVMRPDQLRVLRDMTVTANNGVAAEE